MSVFTQAVTKEGIALMGLLDDSLFNTQPNLGNSPDWPLFEVVEGLPVTRTETPKGWRRSPVFFTKLLAHCQQGKADIIHLLYFPRSAAPWIWRLRKLGIPVVSSCTMVQHLSQNPWRRLAQRVSFRLGMNLSDTVVASTSVMKQYLQDLGVTTPIEVIPNGVDLKRFSPVKTPTGRKRVRQKLQLDPEWDIILALGSVSPRKGSDILVEAFAMITKERPNTRLVFVGAKSKSESSKSTDFHQRLLHAIESTDARGRVLFLGLKSNVEDYLQAADLFVFPSRREGMPNAMAEAMACGIPVISTPFIGLSEDFGVPGSHYVLSNPDPVDLADEITRVFASPRFRDHLGNRARKWVERTQDLNGVLDRYTEIYRNLTNAQKRDPT